MSEHSFCVAKVYVIVKFSRGMSNVIFYVDSITSELYLVMTFYHANLKIPAKSAKAFGRLRYCSLSIFDMQLIL